MSRINKKTPAKCAICGKEFDSYIKLARHLQYTHKMKSKEYFDKYVEPFEHICRICHKNPTKFINIKDGYSDICSEKTCKLEKIAQIKEKRHGDRNYNNRPKAMSTIEKKSPEEKQQRVDKIIATRNKHKAEDPQYQEKINAKVKQTKFEKYGDENYNNIDKIKETNLKCYGVENVFQSETVKQKIKETNLKNLGVEYPKQSQQCIDKSNETFYKHCEEDPMFLSNRTAKAKETCKSRYGDPNYRNIDQQKETFSKRTSEQNQKSLDKRRKTNYERYGVYDTVAICKRAAGISNLSYRIKDILDAHKIPYEMEFRIDIPNSTHFRLYDFKFGNTILELNGDYFHANPQIYAQNDVIRIRKVDYLAIDIWNSDKQKKELAENNGYIVKYLWENDMKHMSDIDILQWIVSNCCE